MRKPYISSLKGIACLFVALGHFLGAIKYASIIPVNTDFFLWLEKYRLGFILDESFWLYLFFVVSGYLVANSKVATLSQFFVRSLIRFFRLALPIFAACVIIFAFSKVVPFYNEETAVWFENTWLQSAYSKEFSIYNVLLSPIDVLVFEKTLFNSPYWVLRSMMFASFLIYFLTYVKSKNTSPKIFGALFLLLSAASLYVDKIIFVCILGALICYCEAQLHKLFKSKALLVISGLFSLMLCFLHSTIGAIAIFSWMIIVLPQFVKVKKFLETRIFNFFGEISFGIYSFHWPIFCSVGSYVIIKSWNVIGGGYAIFLSIIISVILTTLISVPFYYAVEKPSDRLVKIFRNKLEIFLSKSPK